MSLFSYVPFEMYVPTLVAIVIVWCGDCVRIDESHDETMSSVLGSCVPLDSDVQACFIVGTWHSVSGNRFMDFNVIDNELLL